MCLQFVLLPCLLGVLWLPVHPNIVFAHALSLICYGVGGRVGVVALEVEVVLSMQWLGTGLYFTA